MKPCELCAIKGGNNIQSDGGCRHSMSYAFALAQLRHLYKQLLRGEVKNQESAAKYLLGPVIEGLENLQEK